MLFWWLLLVAVDFFLVSFFRLSGFRGSATGLWFSFSSGKAFYVYVPG